VQKISDGKNYVSIYSMVQFNQQLVFYFCCCSTLKSCWDFSLDRRHCIRYKLTSVFGGDMQNCMSPILAFSTLLGPFTFADFCVNTSPSINSVSSTVPPSFLMTRMSCEDNIKYYQFITAWQTHWKPPSHITYSEPAANSSDYLSKQLYS
jgi:hypothetical protein